MNQFVFGTLHFPNTSYIRFSLYSKYKMKRYSANTCQIQLLWTNTTTNTIIYTIQILTTLEYKDTDYKSAKWKHEYMTLSVAWYWQVTNFVMFSTTTYCLQEIYCLEKIQNTKIYRILFLQLISGHPSQGRYLYNFYFRTIIHFSFVIYLPNCLIAQFPICLYLEIFLLIVLFGRISVKYLWNICEIFE